MAFDRLHRTRRMPIRAPDVRHHRPDRDSSESRRSGALPMTSVDAQRAKPRRPHASGLHDSRSMHCIQRRKWRSSGWRHACGPAWFDRSVPESDAVRSLLRPVPWTSARDARWVVQRQVEASRRREPHVENFATCIKLDAHRLVFERRKVRAVASVAMRNDVHARIARMASVHASECHAKPRARACNQYACLARHACAMR
jgi:hypothetical protein